MGRLQRKKTPASKKKKKQKATTKTSVKIQAESQVSTQKAALAALNDKGVKKKAQLPQKKTQATPTVAAGKPKTNFLNSAIQFLREVKVELKKVTWPSRKQTIGSTVVVIALVMLISLFLGVVDIGLSNLIRIVLQ
jgi:preprotein translocase subunit SecE